MQESQLVFAQALKVCPPVPLKVVGSCASYSLGSGEVVFLRKLVIYFLCYVFKMLSCLKFLENALISALAVLCCIPILLSSLPGYTRKFPRELQTHSSYRFILHTICSPLPHALEKHFHRDGSA